jgi:uncharacterized protein (DUF305 family)
VSEASAGGQETPPGLAVGDRGHATEPPPDAPTKASVQPVETSTGERAGASASRRVAVTLMYSGTVVAPRIAALLWVIAAGVSCRTGGMESGPRVVQPGAPGESSRVISAGQPSRIPYTEADVHFMQGMIVHHAQALEMTALLRARTSRADMKMLALRIDVSQADEIKMMRRWLEVRGQTAPSEHAHDGMPMPGMLTPDQMARLAAATDAEFDRLFLEGMIQHHGGALVMVAELFATPAAGQDAEIFDFASHVDADQRMEIDRMRGMLRAK